MGTMWTVVTIVGSLIALWLIHRLALRAEARGWIHYRNPPRGSVSYGVSRVDAILRPEVEHVIELRDAERIVAEVDESGAPPEPGDDGSSGAHPAPDTPMA